MSWIVLALISTVLFACAVILDKFINANRIKSVYSFAFLLNTAYLFFILVTTYFQRDTFIFGPGMIYSAIAGVFWFFMIERHQEICDNGHHFPSDQKEERVVGSDDQYHRE